MCDIPLIALLTDFGTSDTFFHGRNIFAPAAAHLACGANGSDFGPEVQDPVRLPYPCLNSLKPDSLQGEILFSDKFGNYLTSLGTFSRLDKDHLLFDPWVPGKVQTSYPIDTLQFRLPNGVAIPWVDSYTEVPFGQCAVLLGSSGLLEIVAYCQSTESILGLMRGDIVIIEVFGGK